MNPDMAHPILSPAPLPGIHTGTAELHLTINRRVHLIIGITLLLAYAYIAVYSHGISVGPVTCGIITAATGSLLPDILEPPTGSRHRGICHSRRALNIVAAVFLISAIPVLFAPDIPHYPVIFSASGFSIGYLAHLLADSLTRAGLPG